MPVNPSTVNPDKLTVPVVVTLKMRKLPPTPEPRLTIRNCGPGPAISTSSVIFGSALVRLIEPVTLKSIVVGMLWRPG